MLKQLHGMASDRKLRLFAVACARHQRLFSRSDHARAAAEVAERYADGSASRTELRKAFNQLYGDLVAHNIVRSGFAHAAVMAQPSESSNRKRRASARL